MSLLNIPDYNVVNESDVEQKFIYPFLTHPSFLAIPSRSILTKASIGNLSFVQKTSLPRNYIPDYIIFLHGMPICIIEAKSPNVSVMQAIGEARAYGDILNRQFPAKFNPVSMAVGCNGKEICFGPIDTNEAERVAADDLIIGSINLRTLRAELGYEKLLAVADRLKGQLQTPSPTTPSQFLNPQLLLERVKPNELAPYLTPLYEMFFRSEEPEKIQLILEQAYVDTAELREYDQVLHMMLRQIERALPSEYRTIETDRRREYTVSPELGRYRGEINTHGRMHLIIGSRGSGKSLFIARFFSHLIPEALKQDAVWCIIDFNRAPSSIENIENYVCETFLDAVENLKFNPYDLDGLHRVFAVEINRLNKGPLAALKDEAERGRILSNELLKLSADKRLFAQRLGRYITGDAGRPLIVAFDNVDRRESAQQLHIFQAAQWFRNETRAFALLTLRDMTFERFKNEPPLDAFAQISNFYIRPPRFALVLQKRLKLAIDVGLNEIETVEQTSTGGMRIKYSREHLGLFLQAVYDSLFGGNQPVGRILDALAERDVREALGMFARMLISGHFKADRIIKIGVGGRSDIHNDLLIKILMRADYKVYSTEAGFIKNIFELPEAKSSGNIFLNSEILGFFSQTSSDDRLGGLRRLEELFADMAGMGFDELEVRDCVNSLVKYKLLGYDGEDNERPEDRDLVKITPSGFIHLRTLPNFIEYIASAALQMPIVDRAVSERIGKVWARVERYSDLDFSYKHVVATMVADYLVRYKNSLDAGNPLFRERSREAERLVKDVTHAVNSTASIASRIAARNAAAASRRRVQR